MRGRSALGCLLAALCIWHVIQYSPTIPAATPSLSPDAGAPPDAVATSDKPWGSDTAPISTAASALYLKNHAATPLPALALAAMASTDAADDFINAGAPPEAPADADAAAAGRLAALSRTGVCNTIVAVARANDLPIPFFANLIWQESRFRSRTISPAGALGMAQFIPEAAVEQDLMNPFEPVHALFASGRLLRRLHQHFGNLGLAAAAYNAGPQRIHDWMALRRGLPAETRAYVARITGHQAERWLSREFARGPEAALMPARAPCAEVAEAVKEQAHIVRVARLMAELVSATVPPPPDQSRVAALPAKPAGKQAAVQKKTTPAQKPAVAAQAKPQIARAMKDQSRPVAAQELAKSTPVTSGQAKKRIAAQ
jgi:soluble lytic murein transglycosylase-like protein